MNLAKIAKAEKLLDELTEMLTSGNHSAETLTALLSLKGVAEPALRKAATRTALDGGNPDDPSVAAMRAKLGVTLEADASGTITTVTSLDELLANWDTRLVSAVKNAADHPIAKQRAYDAEFLQMMKELHTLGDGNIKQQMILTDIPEQMTALGKDDATKSTMDEIKEAQRDNRFGTAGILGFSR